MKRLPFILGTQYYRPPFPRDAHWEDDLRAMRDAGLTALQLWLVWGHCEPEPGRYVFDDYDRLADLAARQELGLILSTLPELNPFWVPRLHPDAAMVDIEGRALLSVNRTECLCGLTPGGCSDHPEIRKRMTDFLSACADHFQARENLLAWDCWNENRWCNTAPGFVCFCPHSQESQRAFLRAKYGSLEALAEAWGRRYCDWSDVRIGRLAGDSYPEMHDFTEWLCRRAQDMVAWRIAALRSVDPVHPISSHTGQPTVFGGVNISLFNRGIDWDIAAGDSYGFSSFPKWAVPGMQITAEEFRLRCSAVATAGGGKPFWMSELQGGPTAHARTFGPSVGGAEQQSWIWTGISCGAKASIFWCWRPEVFGNESNGFGFLGCDGLREDRAAAMRRTAAVVADHEADLLAYRPDPPQVAVLFQRDSYFYEWMAAAYVRHAYRAPERFLAYPRALERLHIPYALHDDRHLPADAGALKLVIVPNAVGLCDEAVEWLVRFAESGGSVLIENAAGCHGPDTFFRVPGQRPFYRRIGIEETLHRAATRSERGVPAGALGNRDPLRLLLEETEIAFAPGTRGAVALEPDGLPMAAAVEVGRGRVVCVGSVVGPRMLAETPDAFMAWIGNLAREAGAVPAVTLQAGCGDCTFRLGDANGERLLMLVNGAEAQRLSLAVSSAALSPDRPVSDWFGNPVSLLLEATHTTLSLDMAPFGAAVLTWASTKENE